MTHTLSVIYCFLFSYLIGRVNIRCINLIVALRQIRLRGTNHLSVTSIIMENIWLGHSPYTTLTYSACQVNEETKYTVAV